MTIPARPELSFPTQKDAFDALNAHCKEHGYAVRKTSSKPPGNRPKRLFYLVCDKAYNTALLLPTGGRRTGSKRTNCPFKAQIKLVDGHWDIITTNPQNNHLPSISPLAHLSLYVSMIWRDHRLSMK
jgi:hypothetical protein